MNDHISAHLIDFIAGAIGILESKGQQKEYLVRLGMAGLMDSCEVEARMKELGLTDE